MDKQKIITMKNIIKIITVFALLFAVSTIIIACSGSDDSGNPDSDGEKTSNTGRYAGILVGSSGWFVIDFTEESPSATVHFDGNEYHLTTSMPVTDGNEYTDVLFTDGIISMYFSVDGSGQQPAASFSIPGHNVAATIANTEQDTIVLYEGTSHSENIHAGQTYTVDFIYNLALNYSDNTYTIIEKEVGVEGEPTSREGIFTITGNVIDFGIDAASPANPETGEGGEEYSLYGIIEGDTISYEEPGFYYSFVRVY